MNNVEFNFHLKNIKNDNNSLVVLYNLLYKMIIYHVRLNYRDAFYIAEDVAQEFFSYLIRRDSKKSVKHPKAWVFKSCDHIAERLLKEERKYEKLDVDSLPSQIKYLDEVYGEFDYDVNQLDKTTQKIIRMRFVYQFKMSEISQLLNINYGTVRQRISRSVRKIRSFPKDVTKEEK